MKPIYRKSLIVAGIALVLFYGCAKAPPALSPTGRAAFQATRVVAALDVLRNFAIDAEAQTPKVLSTDTTRKIVLYHRGAIRTIGAVPQHWNGVVDTGLTELLAALSADERQRLAPYITLIRTIMNEVIR